MARPHAPPTAALRRPALLSPALLALGALAACWAPGSPLGASAGIPGAAPPPARSCPARTPARKVALRSAFVVGEVAGISYAVAQRPDRDEAVLVWLAEDGSLGEAPLARTPILGAVAGSALHLLGAPRDRSAWFVESIDLSTPDAPRRQEDGAIPGVPVGRLGGFAADSARLVLSQILPRDGAEEHVTHLVDRASGRASERRGFSVERASFCDGSGCALVALDHTAKRSLAIWEPHGGAPGERVEIGPYPGFFVHRVPVDRGALLLEPGPDGWSGAIVAASAPRLRPLPRTRAPADPCPFESVLPGRHPGVVVCKENEAARTLVRWDAAQGTVAAVEALPPSGRREERYAAHPDGVIRVAWDGGSALEHGPETEDGYRFYEERWYFDGGEVALLERGVDDGWTARDPAPLVLPKAQGEFSPGFESLVLVRGLRAAVLISPDGPGEPGWLQPAREPCP